MQNSDLDVLRTILETRDPDWSRAPRDPRWWDGALRRLLDENGPRRHRRINSKALWLLDRIAPEGDPGPFLPFADDGYPNGQYATWRRDPDRLLALERDPGPTAQAAWCSAIPEGEHVRLLEWPRLARSRGWARPDTSWFLDLFCERTDWSADDRQALIEFARSPDAGRWLSRGALMRILATIAPRVAVPDKDPAQLALGGLGVDWVCATLRALGEHDVADLAAEVLSPRAHEGIVLEFWARTHDAETVGRVVEALDVNPHYLLSALESAASPSDAVLWRSALVRATRLRHPKRWYAGRQYVEHGIRTWARCAPPSMAVEFLNILARIESRPGRRQPELVVPHIAELAWRAYVSRLETDQLTAAWASRHERRMPSWRYSYLSRVVSAPRRTIPDDPLVHWTVRDLLPGGAVRDPWTVMGF